MEATKKRRRGKRRKEGAAAARPVIGYVRVSTADQEEHGHSLAAQREDIEKWARRLGLIVAAIHADTLSGEHNENRPGLRAALDAACTSGGYLVAASLSRLARSAEDLYETSKRVRACGADIASASPSEAIIDTSTMVGRVAFGFFAIMADVEKEFIRERTRTVAAHMRRQNRRISGRIPFGYDLADGGKTLKPNSAEQRTIADMQAQRAAGATYRAIVADLNGRGITAKQGGAWSPAVVADVLARARKMAA